MPDLNILAVSTLVAAILFVDHLEGYRVAGQGDRHQKWILHTQIMYKKWSFNFSAKMPLVEVLFSKNPT